MDVATVRAWMLCVNGWGRSGRSYGAGMDALAIERGRSGRYYGSGLDALRERIGTLLRFAHGCSS